MFQNPFSFYGRIRRMEYGISYCIMMAYAMLSGLIVGFSGMPEGMIYILMIPAYWFGWAQGAKRCHDRGNSGWYQLIPFYGIWMLFADSEYGENEYGPNPKGLGNVEEMIDDIGSPK
ncbi:MAG: DUF805 domain-containing protein [Dysgonomonas sp.]|nr:DUF805 domain-containing protein [Dysgonomonas sp.]